MPEFTETAQTLMEQADERTLNLLAAVCRLVAEACPEGADENCPDPHGCCNARSEYCGRCWADAISVMTLSEVKDEIIRYSI